MRRRSASRRNRPSSSQRGMPLARSRVPLRETSGTRGLREALLRPFCVGTFRLLHGATPSQEDPGRRSCPRTPRPTASSMSMADPRQDRISATQSRPRAPRSRIQSYCIHTMCRCEAPSSWRQSFGQRLHGLHPSRPASRPSSISQCRSRPTRSSRKGLPSGNRVRHSRTSPATPLDRCCRRSRAVSRHGADAQACGFA